MRFLLLLSTSILAAASIEPVQLSRSLGFLEPTAQHTTANPSYNIRGFQTPHRLTANAVEIGNRPTTVRFSTGTPTGVVGQPTAFTVNQFSGPAESWRRSIAALQSVTYTGVATGVDLQITPRRDLNVIEFSATLAAGTDPTSFYLEDNATALSSVTITAQAAWQVRNGERIELTAQLAYDSARRRYTFRPVTYDNTLPLHVSANLRAVTDTFEGRTAISSTGTSYVAGTVATNETCRVTTGGTTEYCRDVIVAAFSSSGALVFVSQLGGEFNETASTLAIAPNGNILVSGNTASAAYPVSADALQKTNAGPVRAPSSTALPGGDAYITRLDGTTGDLLHSTFYGSPNSHEDARELSPQGNVLVTVNNNMLVLMDANLTQTVVTKTFTENFPVGARLMPNGEVSYWEGQAAAIVRLDATLANARASVPLGAGNQSIFQGQYLLPNGNLLAGWSQSTGLFVSEISADGTREIRRTTLSPKATDISSVAPMADGGYVLTLSTRATTIPTTPNAMLAATCKGFQEVSAVLQRISATGEITFSSYLPASIGTLTAARASSANQIQFVDTARLALINFDFNAATPPTLACVTGGAIRVVTGAISPGQIITLLGSGFGSANTEVYVNSIKAPLLYLSPLQINAVVPYEGLTTGQTATIEVRPASGAAMQLSTAVRPAAVELFTLDASGVGPSAAFNQDSTLNTQDNPAPVGSIVVLYGTGIGATNPASVTGATAALVPPFAQPLLRTTARIGGNPCEVLYSGAAPGLINGAAQFNLRVPPGLQAGVQPVEIALDSFRSTSSATIWVK